MESLVLSTLLLASALAPQSSPPAGPLVAIRAGRLVDPEAGTTTANVVILVEGAVIKAVGRDLAVPPGATVIDLGAATLLPGLFDCHTHLCTNMSHPAGESVRNLYEALFTTTVSSSNAYRALVGAANAQAMLEAGFTTVRDVGNAGNYADTDLRRAIEEGLLRGPTIVNAGRIIAPLGGQFAAAPPSLFRDVFGAPGHEYTGVIPADRPGLGEPEYLYADTPDELRKAVRQNILFGARVIKVVVDDQPYIYSEDDLRAVKDEAGRAGRRVCAHAMTDAGARNAAAAGLHSVEHGFLMSDETIALMKKNGVVLVGTDFSREVAEATGLPPAFYDRVVERLKRAHKAGVEMAFGTDIFAQPPGKSRGQLALDYVGVYQEAGVAAPEVLRMMTTNASRLLGLEKERGRLATGLAADIIATRDNPLDGAEALKDVVFVMKDGRVVRR